MKNQKKEYLFGTVKAKSDTEFSVLASTAAMDRQGEVVMQNGWQLDNYLKNPVILFAHDYSSLPVGKATKVAVTQKGLEIEGIFSKTDLGQQVATLYKEGILNAVSVGFIPQERDGNVITAAELLELSFVPVPANPEALTQLMVAKGIDKKLVDEIARHGEKAAVNVSIDITEVQRNPNLEQYEEELTDLVDTDDNGDKDEPDETNGLPKSIDHIEILAKRFAGIDEKIGAEISAANRTKIESAITNLKNAVSVLEAWLATASASATDGGKSAPVLGDEKEQDIKKVDSEVVIVLPLSIAKDVQNRLRISDKHNEKTLQIINDALAKKAKATV